MTSLFARLSALLIVAGLVTACAPGATGPADDPSVETIGDQIAEPTDGVANELEVE